jgi:hypothetical protein
MSSHTAFGLVLGAILLGCTHLVMYLPGGISTPALIGLTGLSLPLVVYLSVGGVQRLRQRRPDERPNDGLRNPGRKCLGSITRGSCARESVAEKVVREAQYPVLTLRIPDV